ncbi:type II toxin-antitoxin system VapC family toxin [Conexibacter sp. CPCC 206217]|uniref:type II toxin-antitoxin system VapC family toxin n=1 Tax=Conexibacter sp. CPCC 206217 TaxID=3064574 RepID=UPI002725009F|nr:type II toxin-antitoxin system VapC family toxin [Conexibacter sp. CPCC 206217]MDO8213774.1 type II toxin-antitoxin system VapC family toxin [Conexibacter sp. CPCC 206217]
MIFLVDANVIIYSAVDCEQQAACLGILEAIVDGADGRTSPAVLEEVWHIERRGRLGRLDGLTEQAHRIFSPLVPVTDEAFVLARGIDVPQLGTADRVHVGTCLAHGIETIVTADRGFGATRAIQRVDPGNARAVKKLLAAA